MRVSRILLASVVFLFILVPIYAADVVYITKNKLMVQKEIVNAFEDRGLEVEVVEDRDVPRYDFSGVQVVFVGEGILRNIAKIPATIPTIISNHYYGRYFGLLSRGNLLKVASNRQLQTRVNEEIFDLYALDMVKPTDDDLTFYYVPQKFMSDAYENIGTVIVGSSHKEGSVIAYSKQGNRCFWGVDKSAFWSEEAHALFNDCVSFALASHKHDVTINTDVTNAINGIRIKDDATNQFLVNETTILSCNKKYVIDFRTENSGTFVENTTFLGSIENFSWTASKKDLQPGKTTTSGSKTVMISLSPGIYVIRVEAMITTTDATPLNNVRTRTVTVVC